MTCIYDNLALRRREAWKDGMLYAIMPMVYFVGEVTPLESPLMEHFMGNHIWADWQVVGDKRAMEAPDLQ